MNRIGHARPVVTPEHPIALGVALGGRPGLQQVARAALAWRWQASCADPGIDPELFFSPFGESPARRAQRIAAARATCARCPVRPACLADALETGDEWAIRAGFTPEQRQRLQARWSA